MNLKHPRGGLLCAVILCLAILLSACSSSAPTSTAPVAQPTAAATATVTTAAPIPVFAYYYIWFDPTSWDKNKIDYPLLGNYSSDDPAVMRQHVQWAKAAGIQAFIVSWKSTDKLNRRLDQLVQIAASENFKLAIIYQGLDQQREPIPASQVASDLDYFAAKYSNNPVFDIYGKPLVIWSGTWKFSTQDIASVTQGRRDKLLILASDRDVAGIQRLNGLIDGDAYYFSSVNPDTFPNYQGKLETMAKAVHDQKGLWIAPVAPGFDARAIGGTTVVDRKDGATLQTEMNVAWQASPDAIGLISWNEFTENSYMEPSQKYGHKYLDLLSSIGKAPVPNIANIDSSEPGVGSEGFVMKALALGTIVVIVLGSMVIIARRQ
jgi:hypothetical protein